MRFSRKAFVAILASALLLTGCGNKKITDSKQYASDHGIYVTGGGSYDVVGDVVLRSVQENEGGWKQFNFTLSSGAAIDDFYIVPLKTGVSVDNIGLYDGNIVTETQSQFTKALAFADFEDIESLKETYGFQVVDSEATDRGMCLKAEDTASKLLYFVKNGKAVENVGVSESDLSIKCDRYGISVWVNCEWSGENYDNLFYVGVNEAEQDTTA